MLGLKGDVGVIASSSDTLQPVLELLELLAGRNAQETVAQTLNAAAIGNTALANLTVPAGQTWLVRGISASAATGAAEVLRYGLAVINALGVGISSPCPEARSSLTDAAGAGVVSTYQTARPFLLYAGEAIAVSVRKITTAGNIPIGVSAVVLRFSG